MIGWAPNAWRYTPTLLWKTTPSELHVAPARPNEATQTGREAAGGCDEGFEMHDTIRNCHGNGMGRPTVSDLRQAVEMLRYFPDEEAVLVVGSRGTLVIKYSRSGQRYVYIDDGHHSGRWFSTVEDVVQAASAAVGTIKSINDDEEGRDEDPPPDRPPPATSLASELASELARVLRGMKTLTLRHNMKIVGTIVVGEGGLVLVTYETGPNQYQISSNGATRTFSSTTSTVQHLQTSLKAIDKAETEVNGMVVDRAVLPRSTPMPLVAPKQAAGPVPVPIPVPLVAPKQAARPAPVPIPVPLVAPKHAARPVPVPVPVSVLGPLSRPQTAAARMAQMQLIKAQGRVDAGQALGKDTMVGIKNAGGVLARHARENPAVIDVPAFGRLTLQQVPRVRSRASADYPDVRNISDFVPGWGSFKYSQAFHSDALNRGGFGTADTYLLSYLMRDYPHIFQGRVYLAPYTVRLMNKDVFIIDRNGNRVPPSGVRPPATDRPWLLPLHLTHTFLQQFGKTNSGHANYLYVNHARKTIEIFEPHGETRWGAQVKVYVQALFQMIYPSYAVLSLGSVCPIGPQAAAGKYDQGFCVAYSNLFAVMRVLNPDASAERVYKFMSRGGPEAVRARIDQVAAYVGAHLSRLKL